MLVGAADLVPDHMSDDWRAVIGDVDPCHCRAGNPRSCRCRWRPEPESGRHQGQGGGSERLAQPGRDRWLRLARQRVRGKSDLFLILMNALRLRLRVGGSAGSAEPDESWARPCSSPIFGWTPETCGGVLGEVAIGGIFLGPRRLADDQACTVPDQKTIGGCRQSGSAMLRIRHCGRSNRAEGDASTAENIFFLRKAIRRAAGEGYRMRFEGRCTDGQN